jgi:hypothetical protein
MSMLQCVRNHLKPSGLFAFNTRNPHEGDYRSTHEFEFWHRFEDAKGDEVKVLGKQEFDAVEQNVIYTTKRVWKHKETATQIRLKFTNHAQLLQLIEKAGFKASFYGDTKKSALLPESDSIVCVCLNHSSSQPPRTRAHVLLVSMTAT